MSTSTRKTVAVLICTSGHTTEVQPWAPIVPSVCAFAPCSERFLSAHELGRLTREANARIKAEAAATIEAFDVDAWMLDYSERHADAFTPVPTFDEDGWVVDFTPAPICENVA